jgi:hypothetical protein
MKLDKERFLLKSFGKNLIDKSSHYQNHKDLNDYLVNKNNLKNNLTDDIDEGIKSENQTLIDGKDSGCTVGFW